MTSFSDTLKELRGKAEMTQKALCDKMGGFAQPLLCRYETGKALPGPNTRIALAKALGVEIKDLNLPEKAITENGHNKTERRKAKQKAHKVASIRRRLKATRVSRAVGRPSKASTPVVVSASIDRNFAQNEATVLVNGVSLSGDADNVLAAVTKLLG